MAPPGVIFGGPSPEHDVSILTGLQAARALGDARGIYWAKTGDFFEVEPTLESEDFLDGTPRKAPALRLVAGEGFVGRKRPLELSAIVNCCHGGPGEDGSLQGMLDLAGVPYTGPTVAGAAIGMDKLAFGSLMAAGGLPVLDRVALTPGLPPSFPPPYIVKPRFGGSSIGIEVAQDWATVEALARSSAHLRAGGVVEPYRPGVDDMEIAVRTHPKLELSAIARAVRREGQPGIYGYADKYLGGEGMVSADREFPALAPALDKQLREMATTVAELAGVRGVARVDFLAEGDEVFVNEINTIPGSLSKYLWVDPPLPFAHLLADMLAEALEQPTHHYTSAGADGRALRSAGAIAGKLG